MAKANILFADDDLDFLKTRSEFLEQHGYKIISATEPREAKRIIEQGQVDLAVLDLRLLNDKDKRDFSGLNVAKESSPSVPKIILTRFPTVEAVRKALGPALDGLPPAVDFVAKQEGPQALLTAVRKVLNLDTTFQDKIDVLSNQLRKDYEEARKQAKWNYWTSLTFSIIGVILILIGIGLLMGGLLEAGVPSIIAGVIMQPVGILFSRADKANARVDRYHAELLTTRQFENLLAACEELSTSEDQEIWKGKVIEAATMRWLGGNESETQINSTKAEKSAGRKYQA